MTGCAANPNTNNNIPKPAIVHAQAGQTVKQAVDSLPSSGGVVVLGIGTWTSGYLHGNPISKPNVTIRGSAMPSYNSQFTAMTGGTIVLGPLTASSGADHFTVQDLGVDAGQAYINEQNGGMPADALAIYNVGEVIGAPPVQWAFIQNVSCLGSSPTAPAHCMLLENVTHAYVHNVQTVMNQHGLVLKGTNSYIDTVYARGHGIDSVIVDSDVYAPTSHDTLSNITIEPLVSPGDTKGMIVLAATAPASDITVSTVKVRSPLAWGIYAQGASATSLLTGLKFSDISVDYPGGSPTSEYCMQFVQYVRGVNISNLTCTNMWTGIAPYLPDSTSFGDFTVENSQFSNVGTDAVTTYGQWKISTSSFASVAGNGIVNPFGETMVSGDTFVNIGGTNMLSTGGTFVTQAQ